MALLSCNNAAFAYDGRKVATVRVDEIKLLCK